MRIKNSWKTKVKNLGKNLLLISLIFIIPTLYAQKKETPAKATASEELPLMSNEDLSIIKALDNAIEVSDPVTVGDDGMIPDDGMLDKNDEEEIDWTIVEPPDITFNPIPCYKFKSYPILIAACEGELCGETPYNKAVSDTNLYRTPFVSKQAGVLKKCESFSQFEEFTKIVKPGKAYITRNVKLKNGQVLKKYDLLDIVIDRGEGKYFACSKDKIMLVDIPNSEDHPVVTVLVPPKTENWIKLKTGEPQQEYYTPRVKSFFIKKGYYDPEKVCLEDNQCLKDIQPINQKMIVQLNQKIDQFCNSAEGKVCSKYAPSKCPGLLALETELMKAETANDFKVQLSTRVCTKKWGGNFSYKCEKYTHRFNFVIDCVKKKTGDKKKRYSTQCILR
jgi:hypothetical protein